MKIYCWNCMGKVEASLSTLRGITMWKCPHCGSRVGCDPQGKPLGTIPTEEMRQLRKDIHSNIDFLWQLGYAKREDIYIKLSKLVGHNYHTATATPEELKCVLAATEALQKEILKK